MSHLKIAIIAVILLSGLSGCGTLDKKAQEGFVQAGKKLGVDIDVEDIRIRILGGSGKVTGISIGNPAGYVAENAFEMQVIGLDLKLLSVFSDPLILEDLVVDSPIVNLELKAPSGSNFKDIADKVFKKLNEPEPDKQEKETTAESDDKHAGESARMVIRNLRIEGATFNLRRADGTSRSGTLPTIDLQDVGGENGTTIAGIAGTIAVAMASEILERSLGQSFDRLEKRFKPFLAELSSDVRATVEDSLEEIRQVIHTAAKAGLINFASLSRKIAALSETIKTKLDGILNETQREKLKTLLTGIDADAIATAKLALNERVRQRLLLSPEQLAAVKPIVEGSLDRISRLLERIENGDLDVATYREKYKALSVEIATRLRTVLDNTQFESYKQWAAQVDRRIHLKYFSGY